MPRSSRRIRPREGGFMVQEDGHVRRRLRELGSDESGRQVSGRPRDPDLGVGEGELQEDRLQVSRAPGHSPQLLGRLGVSGEEHAASGLRHQVAVGRHDVADPDGQERHGPGAKRTALRERPEPDGRSRPRRKLREVGPDAVVQEIARDRREHRLGREDLERRGLPVEVLHEQGQRRDVVEVRVRQEDAPDPALRGERKRVGDRAGVEGRLAVDQKRRQAIPGRGSPVGAERPDGER